MAEPVGNPYVALAVDVKTAVDNCGLETFGLARIRGRETRHLIAGVRDPDPILLIDGKVEWPEERLARLGAVAFADNPTRGPVTLGEVDELSLRDAQSPYVAARRGDNALHQTKPTVEGDAFRRCQRLAVLVEHRDRLAAITGKPCVVIAVDRRPEGATLHPAARNPVVIGDSGLPLGSNLVALPCQNASCPCQPTVKLSPTQRLPSLSNIAFPPAT